jgi:acetate kinase
MGTRCGDIDPAIVPYLIKYEDISADNLYTLLNNKSGLLGISSVTNDMRVILKEIAAGNKMAKLAFDVFCYRVKKYISSYLGVLNGADAVVFTAGIGENSPTVREKICADLEDLGIIIDPAMNSAMFEKEQIISTPESKIKVLVIPTNEELMIAKETVQVLKS